jgi:hypothetical protein
VKEPGELGRAGLAQALLQLETEWEARRCAVCGAGKWKNFPFCRRCSIRLQRAHLMRGILRAARGQALDRIMQNPDVLLRWALRYDVARDFLICRQNTPSKNTPR